MTSSEWEGQSGSRKRSRTSEDGGKEGKKARGRPRVDTQDATAADRRRTQIRLAQRAYRQRKETTISSLKNQSTQLHSIIEQMNNTFLRLSDSTLKSGLLHLNPALARELKHATETFTSLIKAAGEVEASEYENGEVAEQVDSTRIAVRPMATASPVEVGWGYSTVPDRAEKDTRQTHAQTQPGNYFQNVHASFTRAQTGGIVSRRQATVGEIWDQSRSSSQRQPASTDSNPAEPLPFGFVDMLNEHDSYSPATQIPSVNDASSKVAPSMTRRTTPPLQLSSLSNKTIAPISTCSHDETTFARRLTRATIEAGFRLLSNANARPSALSYKFRLSLPHFGLEDLRTRFQIMLARNVNEDMDFWETPFIHLGGAGTHYPRKDGQGNMAPRKNSWTVRQIGPLEKRMVRAEHVGDGRWEYLPDVDLSGFEGEWFDAYDVQGYLEDKWGCKLDAKSSFVECLVDDDSSQHQGLGSAAGRRSSGSESEPGWTRSESSPSTETESVTLAAITAKQPLPNAPYTQPSFPTNPIDMSFNQALGLDLAPGYHYRVSNNSGFGSDMTLGLGMVGGVEVLPRQKKKKVAWMEVNVFMSELIKRAVCLGRAPGYRRKDVDAALQKALVSAS